MEQPRSKIQAYRDDDDRDGDDDDIYIMMQCLFVCLCVTKIITSLKGLSVCL